MKYSTFQLIKRIFTYSRRYWPHIAVLFVVSLLATPIALVRPVAMKILIDSGFNSLPLPGFIRFFFPHGYQFDFKSVIMISAAMVILIALLDKLYGILSWVLETFT